MKRFLAVLVTSVALLGFATSAFAQDTLSGGEYLFPPQKLVSTGCYFDLEMQLDGNLVTYGNVSAGQNEQYKFAWWASNTLNTGAYAAMQSDGNFVIYNWADQPVWSSATLGYQPDWVTQQNDGNLVVYSEIGPNFANPVWASGHFEGNQNEPCNANVHTELTVVEKDTNFFGSDYGQPIQLPSYGKPSWCGYYCANDSACRSYTYVPAGAMPNHSNPTQLCFKKSGIPAASAAPGLISGYKVE